MAPESHTSSESDDFADFLEYELEKEEDANPRQSPDKTEHSVCRAHKSGSASPERPSKRQKTGKEAGVGRPNECPPHPGTIHGMCIRCGQAVESKTDGNMALKYIHAGLRISDEEAGRIRAEGLVRMRSKRKLLLVLDLDHTLLNSTRFSEVSPIQEAKLQDMLAAQDGAPDQMLFRFPDMSMWTKLRPYLRQFLEAASQIAEMHIYTHGDQSYSAAMGRILDPADTYFRERIMSQADSTQRHVKDLDVMLGAESAVLILDDTVGVWPNHGDNLIQVERYLFFPADAKRFKTPASLLEQGKEESEDQGQLSTSLGVIQTLHSRLYPDGGECSNRDVRDLLQEVRQEILKGVAICFTQVIPVDTDRPGEHFCWKLALKLGARCFLELADEVSHVVGGSPYTEKAVKARKRKLHVVSIGWLLASGVRWKRMPEDQFPLLAENGPSSAAAPVAMDEEQDLEAALDAAGGGRGVAVDQPQ